MALIPARRDQPLHRGAEAPENGYMSGGLKDRADQPQQAHAPLASGAVSILV